MNTIDVQVLANILFEHLNTGCAITEAQRCVCKWFVSRDNDMIDFTNAIMQQCRVYLDSHNDTHIRALLMSTRAQSTVNVMTLNNFESYSKFLEVTASPLAKQISGVMSSDLTEYEKRTLYAQLVQILKNDKYDSNLESKMNQQMIAWLEENDGLPEAIVMFANILDSIIKSCDVQLVNRCNSADCDSVIICESVDASTEENAILQETLAELQQANLTLHASLTRLQSEYEVATNDLRSKDAQLRQAQEALHQKFSGDTMTITIERRLINVLKNTTDYDCYSRFIRNSTYGASQKESDGLLIGQYKASHGDTYRSCILSLNEYLRLPGIDDLMKESKKAISNKSSATNVTPFVNALNAHRMLNAMVMLAWSECNTDELINVLDAANPINVRNENDVLVPMVLRSASKSKKPSKKP